MIICRCFLAVLSSLTWVSHVAGSYEVEVTVHSYRNPSGRCDECRSPDNPLLPRCCDEDTVRPRDMMCSELETCDTAVTICIRPLGSTGISCDEPGQELLRATVFYFDTNSFNFASGFFDFFEFPNPGPVLGTGPWRGLQLIVTSVDCSGIDCGIIERIDSFTVDINITVGTASPEIQYIGNAGIARLNVSFEVRCADNFYGQQCLTTCSNFESCAGCGLPGFTGGFCQYDIDDCEGINCNNNGDCTDEINGFTCDCEPGFTGETCEFDIDDCEDVDCNNGECVDEVNSFMCSCEDGFMGEACAETDRCFGMTCSGNGQCVNSPEEQFTCVCDSGYTGRQCQEELSVNKAASDGVGGIVGGVLGALIGVILVSIIVVGVVIGLFKVRRSQGHSLAQSHGTDDILPGDNPAYGAGNGHSNTPKVTPNNAEASSANGGTDLTTSMSLRERDFDNPLYSSAIVPQDPYTSIDAETDAETGNHYTVPDSPSCNVYDRVAGEGVAESGVYYSVIK